MSDRRPFIVIACALLVLIVFDPRVGFLLKRIIGGMPSQSGAESEDALQREIASLKAEVARLETLKVKLPASSAHTLRVEVYSRYPFAFKDELSVDAGSDQGVGVGAAAVFDGVLVGKVSKTYSSTSLIQTLFDPRMKVAVRVGKGAVDALLQGGLEPRLTLISKNAKIAKGDVVYSADYSAPYGISIGTVGDVALSPDNLFQEASVSFPYDLNTVRTLDIIMDWNHALQTTR